MDSESIHAPEAIRLPLIQAVTESWYHDHTDPCFDNRVTLMGHYTRT